MEENWILLKFSKVITTESPNRKDYLERNSLGKNIKLNRNLSTKTVIDWELIEPKFSFCFDFPGSEGIVSSWLMNSEIMSFKKLILDLGPEFPIITVPNSLIVSNWYEFVQANGFCGITVFSEDWKLIMEFTDDSKFMLYSNFLIKK